MKIIYLKKEGGLRAHVPWTVTTDGNGIPLDVEDDIEAPIGAVWDGDYRSGRPTFITPPSD